MKECFKCHTELNIDDELCPNCGMYVKFPKALKFFLLSFLIWILFPYAFYLMIKDVIKFQQIKNGTYNRPTGIKKLKSFYLGNAKLRKKDGNIVRGDCEIIFENTTFKIKQGEEIVENAIDSIYQLDLWKYDGLTYFKIFMRSHTDYKFEDTTGIANQMISIARFNGIDIDDNRIKLETEDNE